MRITRTIAFVAPLLALAATGASAQSPYRAAREAIRRASADAREFYQGRRGPEQNDTVSRRIKVGRDGSVSIANISGDIVVSTGGGDEVSIDAVKRGRGDRRAFDRVQVVIEEHPGRVEIRTEHPRAWRGDNNVSVDYTVVVPEGASVDLRSISGNVRVTGVKGSVRAQSISGNVTATNAPRVEFAKTVSGNVDLTGVSHDGDLSASSVSGNVRAAGLKTRALDVGTVSGEVILRDVSCERLSARSISGGIEYSGLLGRNGRYEANSHSGSVRFMLAGGTGFELNATSFSGGIRSDFPLTVGGSRNPDIRLGRRRGPGPGDSLQAAFGDGSASLGVHTFSGNITIAKSSNK